jgi:hypothetical protein
MLEKRYNTYAKYQFRRIRQNFSFNPNCLFTVTMVNNTLTTAQYYPRTRKTIYKYY